MDIRRYFTSSQNVDLISVENTIEDEISNISIQEVNTADATSSGVNVTTNSNTVNSHFGIINDGEYEFIPGQRKGTQLLYLKKENCLYTPINNDKYGKRFKCYTKYCAARATVRPDGKCEKSKKNYLHVEHETHCKLKASFIAMAKIKTSCANVEELCSGSSQMVSVRDIFDAETIK